MKKIIKHFLVRNNTNVKTALKKFDVTKEGILYVIDKNNRLMGSVTGGDIRRWVLNDGDNNKTIFDICNKSPFFVKDDFNYSLAHKLLLKKKLGSVPVINKNKEVVDIIFWYEIIKDKKHTLKRKIKCPVVIMAGGFGKRLDPFTRVLPKPLIPIGSKTIVEVIIENFREHKIKDFYLSINYKSKIIKSYFDELNPEYNLKYIFEEKPLGTGGSLKLIQNKIKETFFLINCDTVIKEDYYSIYDFHKKNKFAITVVSSMKNYIVPYGICKLNKDGSLEKIEEKPELNFLANTGMYLIEPKFLKFIPKDTYFDFTQLIEILINRGEKIGVFPVKENDWLDVGVWDEYKKTTKILDIS